MLQVKRRVPIYSRYFGKTHYKMHMATRRQKVTENYYCMSHSFKELLAGLQSYLLDIVDRH